MASKFNNLPRAASGPLKCPLEASIESAWDTSARLIPAIQSHALLHSSYFNKGSAFTKEERYTFHLHGLLPPNIQTLDEQVSRAYEQYSSRHNDLAKNTFMASMKAQNEVLYYRVCCIFWVLGGSY